LKVVPKILSTRSARGVKEFTITAKAAAMRPVKFGARSFVVA
jgi:hypothetical protein